MGVGLEEISVPTNSILMEMGISWSALPSTLDPRRSLYSGRSQAGVSMPKFVVRYGVMRHLAIMSARDDAAFTRGTQVIARTERGLEAAVVLCEATPHATRALKTPGQGQVLRQMTAADAMEHSKILNTQREEF